MSPSIDLSQRSLVPELMDAPDVGSEPLGRALRDIERLNRASLAARPVWDRVAGLARRGPVRVLDLASGGGYLALDIAARAKRAGLPVEVHGSDLGDDAVAFANRTARERDLHVRFFQLDAVGGPIPRDFDVITSTLFLHHLTRPEAVAALAAMREATRRLVLVNDLRRSRAGHLLARLSTRVLSRSPMVHVDGPRSVERAFTLDEARDVARDAGLEGARVRPTWPFRLVIDWERAR